MKSPISTRLIVIGGSAGSLQVIIEMIKNLDDNIHIPILLVIHRKAQSGDILRTLLQQFTRISVVEVEDKTQLEDNTIYIVPADYHLLFENTKMMSLDSSEKMNYSRPSIDVTFRSAAEIYGEDVIGVLLSGANADGVEGLNYIKKIMEKYGFRILNPQKWNTCPDMLWKKLIMI
nr:chemotaxis protein CheB [Chryseobacterium sp. CH25]